ncbi:hypothetical protein UCDDS831_g09145 [Diplodia seriata]|uniref:Uncharacterized protein n=1 Tax=Diplodia seriata TaxID=420778 RepID=A0A0G2DRI2_9PEZI|nr:hypothetical protein UCDDS831_g09145 [Diplodia seriata]
MLPSLVPITLLALQSANFVLGGPIQARNNPPWDTPSDKDIRERIDAYDGDEYEYVFYLGRMPKDAAKAWVTTRPESNQAITLWETDDGELTNDELWKNSQEVQQKWCAEFAKQARGTAWVMWKNGDKIPRNEDSWYTRFERPHLEGRAKGPGHDLEELIQINMQDTKEIYQINPVDVRDYKGKQCKWHGTAPKCDAKCPDGTKKITESKYGDTPNEKCEGDDRKVFCCKDD